MGDGQAEPVIGVTAVRLGARFLQRADGLRRGILVATIRVANGKPALLMVARLAEALACPINDDLGIADLRVGTGGQGPREAGGFIGSRGRLEGQPDSEILCFDKELV